MKYPAIDMKATGARIAELRIEKGISVKALQTYLGLARPQAVYCWQRGEYLPSTDNLLALAKFFGVTVEDILVTKE